MDVNTRNGLTMSKNGQVSPWPRQTLQQLTGKNSKISLRSHWCPYCLYGDGTN